MPSPLRWTGTSYRDPDTGKFVSSAAIRRALEESLVKLSDFTEVLYEEQRTGAISLAEWRAEMRLIIKQTMMAAAELAHGGRAQMTQADYGRVGQAVRRQYEFLENWVQQIQTGQTEAFPGRARQYLRASRAFFLSSEAQVMSERGFLARNVLRPAEHCAECIAERDKGLVPVQFLVPIGQRQCRGNCRCFFVYEKVA